MCGLGATQFAAVSLALKTHGASETPKGLEHKETALLRALSIG